MLTRGCLSPWKYVFVWTDGSIKPCCDMNGSYDNIFNYVSDDIDLEKVLNSKKFINLRKSLLEGNLEVECTRCQNTPYVDTNDLKEMVRDYFVNKGEKLSIDFMRKEEVDYSRIFYIESGNVELSHKCNFHCIYCYHSIPGFKTAPPKNVISEEYFSTIIEQYMKLKAKTIGLSCGSAEFTLCRNWNELCEYAFTKYKDIKFVVTSNFGKKFTDNEIETLSKFFEIVVSCDSADPNIYKKMRKGGDLSVLLSNIKRVRYIVQTEKRKPPIFTISCVVTNINISGLEDLIVMGMEKGIINYVFNNLTHVPGTKGDGELFRISELPDIEKLRARDILTRVRERINDNRGFSFFTGDFDIKNDEECKSITFHEFVPSENEKIYNSIFNMNFEGTHEIHLKRFYSNKGILQEKKAHFGLYMSKGNSISVFLGEGIYKVIYKEYKFSP